MNNRIRVSLMLYEQKFDSKEDSTPRKKPVLPTFTDNLSSWLEVAAYGLVEHEKPRIYADTKEHHQAALETYKKYPIEVAEYMALKDLGDAKIVNRKYRKLYLTDQDQFNITNLQKRSWWTRSLFYFNSIFLCLGLYLILFQPPSPSVKIGFQDAGILGSILYFTYFFISQGLLFFEKEVKQFLHKRFSKYHILISQVLMIFLSFPLLQIVINNIKNIINSKYNRVWDDYNFSITPFDFFLIIPIIVIVYLVYCWLVSQIPITIKTIRRLRS